MRRLLVTGSEDGAVFGQHAEKGRVGGLVGDEGAARNLVERAAQRVGPSGQVAAVGGVVEDLLQARLVAVLERQRERRVGPIVDRRVRCDDRGDLARSDNRPGRGS